MHLVGILILLINVSPYVATHCDSDNYGGPRWFNALVYCGYSTGSAGLLACLNTTPWGTGVIPAIGPNLLTEVNGGTQCAVNCVSPFVNAFNSGMSNAGFKTKCGSVWGSTTLAVLNSQACMQAMYDMLNKFNACASNGADLRTGLPTTRCLYDDFIGILRDYTPYIRLLDLAAAQVAPINYRAHVGVGFSTRLDSLPCAPCFDSLYGSLLALSSSISSTCQGDDKFKTTCSSTLLGPALVDFGVCAGGFSMYTLKPNYCTPEQQANSADLFLPYRSGVECVYLLRPGNYNPTYDCVGLYNGVVDAPQVPCTTCMINALGNILFQMNRPYCQAFGAYSQLCISSYTGLNGMLAQFQLCAGFKLITDNPSCAGFEWDQVLSSGAGYFASLFMEGIAAPSFNDAAAIIRTDISLRQTAIAVSNITCFTCFRAFTADSWFLWSKNITTRNTCAPNIFSDECFYDPGVTKIRNRFKACSGHELLPEHYNRCTEEEVASMAEFAGEIFKIGISSTSADPVKQYMASSVLDTGVISGLCGMCYIYYGTELVKLDDQTKTVCDSYYSCTLEQTGKMTQIRQGFFTCAGRELIVSSETSIVVSTTPPPYSVVSFVPLYAGNGTTKSQSTTSCLSALLLTTILLLIP